MTKLRLLRFTERALEFKEFHLSLALQDFAVVHRLPWKRAEQGERERERKEGDGTCEGTFHAHFKRRHFVFVPFYFFGFFRTATGFTGSRLLVLSRDFPVRQEKPSMNTLHIPVNANHLGRGSFINFA